MSDEEPPGLLDTLFGDVEIAPHFSDRARLQAMLDVEAALAGAEAELGIVPRGAVDAIRAAARAELYDVAAIAAAAAADGNLAIPLVRQLTRRVEDSDRNAARYVHWGATSQDIIDTGLVLQLQRGVPFILKSIERAGTAATQHATRHASTAMAGRTWLQQSTPITFGVKAAGWTDALVRQRSAIAGALEQTRVLQLGGASGTLAALGERGPAVAGLVASKLGLAVPAIPWHAHRDRIVHMACALGVACGTLGKIARDVALMAQTEVGEASEGTAGSSSAMPHKQNPVGASVALAAAVRAPGLVATMLAAMPQEHERGLGGWQAEWTTLPELVLLTAGAAKAVASMVEGLVIDESRMRENLERTRGLIASEAVTMALAAHVGRSEAHRLVEDAARRAGKSGGSLADALAADPAIVRHLTRVEIDRCVSPASYVEAARVLVEGVVRKLADT